MKSNPPKRQDSPFRRIFRGPIVYLLVVLAGLWVFLSFATRGPQASKISLTSFRSEISSGRVDSATFLERDQRVVGKLVSGTRYETTYPGGYEEALTRELLDAGVRVVTLSAEERSLEDAYLSILAEARR